MSRPCAGPGRCRCGILGPDVWTAGLRVCPGRHRRPGRGPRHRPRRPHRRSRQGRTRGAPDAPSRARRTGHLDRRRHRPRFQPALDHRHRTFASAAALGPADQPDRYVLVFNGEIYNYLELRQELAASHGAVFATDGDGEAIVAGYHYWGPDVLPRLRGMFAFVLWDTLRGELFCARDPFGIKPLFMAGGPGGTAVGSEKKSLLDMADLVGFDTGDGGIDQRALQHYTVLQYVPEPETLHRGCAGWSRDAGRGSARIGRPRDHSLLHTAIRRHADHPRHRTGPLRRDHRGARGLGGQAHASRRHGRGVSVRGSTPPRSPRWRCGTTPS